MDNKFFCYQIFFKKKIKNIFQEFLHSFFLDKYVQLAYRPKVIPSAYTLRFAIKLKWVEPEKTRVRKGE